MAVRSPAASNFGLSSAPSSTACRSPRGLMVTQRSHMGSSRTADGRLVAGRSFSTPGAWRKYSAEPAHHAEEAGLLGRVVAEDARKLRRDRAGALLLDAAHGHAHVLGFDDDRDAARLQHIIDGADDLGRHAL